jgi:hypothetical protein
MQQALLEAVGSVQTPTSPAISRRSGRSSIPAYDPAQPNAPEEAVPYDPTAWGAVSEVSSESRRSSAPAPAHRRTAVRYSLTTPAYNPSSRLYDPAGTGRALAVVAGGEPSPGYRQYGAAHGSPTAGGVAARLDGLFETVDRFQRRVESRLDRIEGQLGAISEALEEQVNGAATPNSSGGVL